MLKVRDLTPSQFDSICLISVPTLAIRPSNFSDVNKDCWTCKDKDNDQAYKDQDKD